MQTAPIVVENYPLVPRSIEEVENIRHVIDRRRIENAERKLRRQILSDNSNGYETSDDISNVGAPFSFFSSTWMFILSVTNHHHWKTITSNSSQTNNPLLCLVLSGSQRTFISIFALIIDVRPSTEFQVDTSALYNQFELYTQEQKWTQIALLNDLIYKIKEAFNKEFENVYQKKLQELAKIRERNTRIKQINADLDDTTPVWEPDLTEKEKPQLLFDVKDSEVQILPCQSAQLLHVNF